MHLPRPRASLLRWAALPALWICACTTPFEPLTPVPLLVEVNHFAGTTLTGPTGEEPDVDSSAGAWGLELRVTLADHAAAGDALPARLVVVDGLTEPFRTRSELALGARVIAPEAQVHALWSTRRVEALVRGGTTVFTLEPEGSSVDAPRPSWERLEVEVSRRLRDPATVEVALGLTGLVSAPVAGEPGSQGENESPATELARVRERIVLEGAPRSGQGPWRLVFPAPTASAPKAVVLIELELTPSVPRSAVARASTNLERSHLAASSQATGLSGEEGFLIESTSALEALSRRKLQRSALLYLASETGAELLAELALIADIESLADLRSATRERVAALPEASLDPHALGWLLESVAWLWLAGLAADDDESAPIPAELEALLLHRAGEAARWPDLLVDAVNESGGVDELRARLEHENHIFLEDADPAARVRAYDWLAVRGLAPEGFDPLASASERRAVLARLEAAREAGNDEEGGP